MSILNINTTSGIVTSNDTRQLTIVTQPTSTGWNASVNVAQTLANINRITIHHTGAESDGPVDITLAGFNERWRTMPGGPWSHPGYHFVIRPNGDVWQISRLTRTSNGVGGHNNNNIHIAVMGLFWDGVIPRPERNSGTPYGENSRILTATAYIITALSSKFI